MNQKDAKNGNNLKKGMNENQMENQGCMKEVNVDARCANEEAASFALHAESATANGRACVGVAAPS